ncbi:MAG TPA: Lrp/AsnC ligand binding domain-containing protein [Chloroflexota bacterium]|nr:Lrp/AsnC ligand binding domain-containing protein [Chloroflexota bacterium]
MRLAEVLAQVDGLSKRFVYYLEDHGYIHPARVAKQRITRRDYAPEDVRRIAAIWAYHRRGISVQRAVELVDRGAAAQAFVFVQVPARRWRDALEVLDRFEQVLEASVVYGESEDLVARIRAPDDGDVYAVLGAAFRQGAIVGQPTILKVGPPVIERDGRGDRTQAVQAYVLVKASAKQIEDVLAALRKLDGVAEASVVYGETDVICRLEVASHPELDRLVMRELHAIPAVESTRTFVVVGDMSWRR